MFLIYQYQRSATVRADALDFFESANLSTLLMLMLCNWFASTLVILIAPLNLVGRPFYGTLLASEVLDVYFFGPMHPLPILNYLILLYYLFLDLFNKLYI